MSINKLKEIEEKFKMMDLEILRKLQKPTIKSKMCCDRCKRVVRIKRSARIGREHLCGRCKRKVLTQIPGGHRPLIPLNEFLYSIHEIKTNISLNKNGTPIKHCYLNFPSCFMNKKVKLVIVE